MEAKTVVCSGEPSQNNMGHPQIFLCIEPDCVVFCPYCDREFSNPLNLSAKLKDAAIDKKSKAPSK